MKRKKKRQKRRTRKPFSKYFNTNHSGKAEQVLKEPALMDVLWKSKGLWQNKRLYFFF